MEQRCHTRTCRLQCRLHTRATAHTHPPARRHYRRPRSLAATRSDPWKEKKMSTLLKDLIHIPTTTGDEDYVLRLTDSVGTESAVASTLDDYVVTDKIRDAFSSALNLVAEAITTDTSKGAFLAGSFGSGKSHFMAVLHAILRHEPLARKKTELQGVITQYDPQLREKNILPLAFHLLGANTMAEARFSGYIRQIQDRHDAARPARQRQPARRRRTDAHPARR